MQTRTTTISLQQALVELRAMFPETDPEVISEILTLVRGNMNSAVAKLLDISDPDFGAHPLPPEAIPDEATARQIAEDERLARQMASELAVSGALSNRELHDALTRDLGHAPTREEVAQGPSFFARLSQGTKDLFSSWFGDGDRHDEEEARRPLVDGTGDDMFLPDEDGLELQTQRTEPEDIAAPVSPDDVMLGFTLRRVHGRTES